MTIKRFHELLTLQITGCFYVNGQYVNQDDVVYIPVSDQKLNIRLIPFPKSQANNPNDSIINFTWDKASKRLLDRNNIHILEIDKHSSNGEGTIITATALHNGNTITASTRIVVVELDVDQKITNSTYAYDPNDDRHFHHYPTYNQNQVRGLPARFKYYPIPAIPNEDLPLIVKPRETPPNVLQYRTNGASFNLGVPQNGRAGEYTLNLNGIGGVVQGQHLIELMVGTQVARAVNVQRRNPYVIPVTFIQLTLRLPDGTNKTSNLTPNTYLNTTNEILARVGITIQPSNQVLAETIIDNDGILSYDPANLLASPEVTNFLANSPAINQCRQQNRMAIVMLPGLDRIVGVGGDNEVPGVAPRGGFVVFLNGGGTNRPSNTLAHEIGHAYFNLRHPFDEFQADHAQGEDTFNLMDYDHGRTQQYFRGYFFPSLNAANIIIR